MNPSLRSLLFLLLVLVTTAVQPLRSFAGDCGGAGIAMIKLRTGDQLAGRTDENDRLDWKLPAKRLEHFRAAGVVINEEQHITAAASGVIVSTDGSGSMLRVTSHVASHDVPRNQQSFSTSTYDVQLAPDNEPRPAQDLSVADAAMVGLPVSESTPLRCGQRWRTRLAVVTTLGSGTVTFDHQVAGANNGLVEIDVTGSGEITGKQYHLPKLLPGTIELAGSAWYDPQSGLITQESYSIHNQLLKPAEGEQIGFDQHVTVDASTWLVHRSLP